MTGFGRGAATSEKFSVAVDLKTVNNRFLDIHLRLGADMASVESVIRKRIGEQLSRGRVDVSVSLDRSDDVSYEINHSLVAGFIAAMRELQTEFSLPGEPDVNVLARLPGAIQPIRDGGLSEDMIAAIGDALNQALADLNRMREQEGAALAAEMHGRLNSIEAQVPVIETVAAGMVENYRARLQRRISELLARDGLEIVELDQGRLAQEVAYLADRSDISEELARLRSHVQQFRASIDSVGEVGKRLDFVLQELNREANTVLSKATDLAIKEAALIIKAEVEKLREQVQNVE
jgi:uncharacterized protein (TIGR00255 family)